MLYEEIHYNSRQQGSQNCAFSCSDDFSSKKDERKHKRNNDTTDIESDFDIAEFLPEISAIALTKASPEFIITLAMTESATPKPRTTIPHITKTSRTGYELTGINETHHIPKSVNQPKRNDKGSCKS